LIGLHHLATAAFALSAAILSGCAGATRLPLRAKGPTGETLQSQQLDLSFLDAPGTRRQEVLGRLRSVDTSYSNPRLFWGRWSESKWGYWWFIAGGYSAAGDAKRIWHVHNLLVTFDENGTVSKRTLIDDDKSLWGELQTRLAVGPELDLSELIPLEVSSPRNLTKIILAKDSVELLRCKGKRRVLQISPQEIVRFSHSRPDARDHLGITCHTLHLAEKTEWGKSIYLCTTPANVVAIFQYLQQAGPPTMRWD